MLTGMKAYSLDLRHKILRVCDERLSSQLAIAAMFGVSQLFVEKLLRRRRDMGLALLPTKGYAAAKVEHAYARAHELCAHVGDTPALFSVLR